jgi:hypothetical protein
LITSFFSLKVFKSVVSLKWLLVILLFIYSTNSIAQYRFFKFPDTLNLKRNIPVSVGLGTIWGGSLVALQSVWYDGYPKTKMHTFNDNAEWMQMDKLGHAYTSYRMTNVLKTIYKWTGVKHQKAVFLAGGITLGYMASLEVLDGQSAEWGFSWGDIGSNAFGVAAYTLQDAFFHNQVVLLKRGFSKSPYASIRPEILGSNYIEQYLKDYNGQTYWYSISPKSIWKNSSFPHWLCFSFGYSVDAKINGMNDSYTASNGQTYIANREYLFSLDIDVSKLPIKPLWLKKLILPINAIKIPFPSLLWRNGVCYGVPMYF